jgi:hypothetical protein
LHLLLAPRQPSHSDAYPSRNLNPHDDPQHQQKYFDEPPKIRSDNETEDDEGDTSPADSKQLPKRISMGMAIGRYFGRSSRRNSAKTDAEESDDSGSIGGSVHGGVFGRGSKKEHLLLGDDRSCDSGDGATPF